MVSRVVIDEEYANNMLTILARLNAVADRLERLTTDMETRNPLKDVLKDVAPPERQPRKQTKPKPKRGANEQS